MTPRPPALVDRRNANIGEFGRLNAAMSMDRILTRLKDQGHRVVLFSQFTSMLDILSDFLTYFCF